MPVEIKGIVEISRAMRKLAPDIMRELQNEVRPLARETVTKARVKLPATMGYELRNFNDPGYERKSRTGRTRAFPSYNAVDVRRGLTYSMGQSRSNRSGYVSLLRLLNKSAAGGIIETAGRDNLYGSRKSQSKNPDAGGHFIRALSNSEVGPLKQYGKNNKTRGRLLFAAWYETQNRLMPQIVAAYDKAGRRFKQRLDLAA